MLNHILVATDLAERSTVALRRAAALKQRLGSHLTVLHVLEQVAGSGQKSQRQAIETLQEQVSTIFGDDARHLWLKVLEGPHDATIIAEAEVSGSDLIVLGDGRKPGWRERFVGTTTARVVRMSERPVLVARTHDGPYRRLLCAFDGSPAACRALGVSLQIANQTQCLVLHANQRGTLAEFAPRKAGDALMERKVQTMLTALRATLQQVVPTPAEPEVRIVDGNVHFLARDCMREFNPDLVAVGTHSSSPGATTLLGSFACDLLVDTGCDVLIAPPAQV
jgi:nucleotide-binding universal stress UspA family protein